MGHLKVPNESLTLKEQPVLKTNLQNSNFCLKNNLGNFVLRTVVEMEGS